MAGTLDHGDPSIQGINVTPLVDVVLVLLIILMVTAGYVVSQTIPIDLPKGSTGEPTNLPLAITIDASGRCYLDAQQVDLGVLRARVRRAHEGARETHAEIAADGSTSHRSVVTVLDLLRQEGVTHFAINVQPDEVAPRPEQRPKSF